MSNKGLSIRQLALMCNMSKTTIQKYIKRINDTDFIADAS